MGNTRYPQGLTSTERGWYLHLLQGNETALDMADMLISLTHVWDDLIDKDRPVPDEEINSAFSMALVRFWKNDFFREHNQELLPLLEQGVHDWWDANILQREKNYPAAFVLRCSVISVVIRATHIIGGEEWGRGASIAIRRRIFDDYSTYVSDFEE